LEAIEKDTKVKSFNLNTYFGEIAPVAEYGYIYSMNILVLSLFQ
jgi:hypothetical protein